MALYVYDHSKGATSIEVPCRACGRRLRLVDALIDLDGPPFAAYYHPEHAPAGAVRPCTHPGCQREHARLGSEVR